MGARTSEFVKIDAQDVIWFRLNSWNRFSRKHFRQADPLKEFTVMVWYGSALGSLGWLEIGVLCLLLLDRAAWQNQQVVYTRAQGHRR